MQQFFIYLIHCLVLFPFYQLLCNGQQKNEYRLSFDPEAKCFSVSDEKQNELIAGLQVVVHTSRGDYYSGSANFGFKKPRNYSREDNIGKARVYEITAVDKGGEIEIVYRAYVYSDIPGIILEVVFSNNSGKPIHLYSIEPLHVTSERKGRVNGSFTKALLNGAMYYDAGKIQNLDSDYAKVDYHGEIKGVRFYSKEMDDNPKTAYSWWNIGLFNDYESEGLSIGYIGNPNSLGRIKWHKESESTNSLIVESVYYEGFTVSPGEKISSDRVLICKGPDPYTTLETYAGVMGRANEALTGEIINGWCNWFSTYDYFSENEILKNARIIREKLLPYGMTTVQIDEGYQVNHGDWQGNPRFPGGLKGFADSIRAYGLKPGIWIAPFVISGHSLVYRDHPEWLLKKRDGTLQRVGPWPGEDTDWFRNESPKRYGLDITHPDAEKWFTALIDTLVRVYGFEMIKIDFVAWSVFSAEQFYDSTVTPAEVYRKALSINHRMGGQRCHILDCGPGHVSVGNIHSMRIELDVNYGFFPAVWTTYFRGAASSAGALGKRYYFHNRTWTNDIDHICIDLVPYHNAQAIVSLIALSGGNTMSGDRLITLDDVRMNILQKAFPSSQITARPVDLLDRDPQMVFAVPCRKDSDEWTVVGFFNPDTASAVEYTYPLERLWLDPFKQYVAFDFWKQQFAGILTNKISVNVDPGSVTLLSIHEKSGTPGVISSTRHVLQGLIENEGVVFDKNSLSLSGRYLGPKGSHNSLFIYVPEGYLWDPSPGKLFKDYGTYSVKNVNPRVLRVDFVFDGMDNIDWSIEFRKDE